MNAQPWWAALTVWAVVNLVNLLQTAGFISRIVTGSIAINHRLGIGIIALALPAAVALVAFVREQAGWLALAGPVVFLAFVALEVAVDYVRPVEFRTPARPGVLAPYLVLFFGAIVLMGIPMFEIDRSLWLVTAATSALLIASMVAAMRKGVG